MSQQHVRVTRSKREYGNPNLEVDDRMRSSHSVINTALLFSLLSLTHSQLWLVANDFRDKHRNQDWLNMGSDCKCQMTCKTLSTHPHTRCTTMTLVCTSCKAQTLTLHSNLFENKKIQISLSSGGRGSKHGVSEDSLLQVLSAYLTNTTYDDYVM